VPGDAGLVVADALHELPDRALTRSQFGEDATPRRIGQDREDIAHASAYVSSNIWIFVWFGETCLKRA